MRSLQSRGRRHHQVRSRARARWPKSGSGLLAAFSLAISMLAIGARATPAVAGPQRAPAGEGRQPPSLEHVQELLRGWRAAEAEEELAALEASGMERALLVPALATVRFYQGEYDEALRLLAGAPDSELRRSLLAAQQVTRGMKEVRTPDGRWRIRVRPGPDEVLVPLMLEALPRIREANDAVFDTYPATPVVIEVLEDAGDLARATGLTEKQIEDSGTIAICKFNRIMLTTPLATLRGYSWLDTLSHEYLHLLINHRSFQRVPIWLHEGLARYNESRYKDGRPEELDPDTKLLLLQALADGELIGFDEMSPSMALLPTQRHTELAFAEVLTIIDLLYRRIAPQGVNRVLDRLARRETDEAREAVAAELGQPFSRFERAWKDELRGWKLPRLEGEARPSAIRFRKGDTDPMRLELDEVDRKARDLAYLGQLLRGQQRHRAALIEYRKAAAVSRGVSPVIQNWIAATELELDRPQAALDGLAGVAERNPGYSPTYVHQGLALARLKDDAGARSRLEAALALNPYDPRVRRELHRIYREGGDPRAAREAEALRLLGGSEGGEESGE